MKKVALFGASGLVGATVLEMMSERGAYEVRPIIHTTGNAWRLARRGQKLTQADITDLDQVKAAVEGCDYVINCALGSNQALIKGIENLIEACKDKRVQRLVHLSSVLVYGDRPAPEAVSEDAAPQCDKGSYAWFKLRQDEILEEACQKGFEAVTLCIPNVTGTYSRYLVDAVSSLRQGQFALVDGGKHPIVAGDVRNIAHALLLATRCQEADGTRIFLNDGPGPTWADFARALAPLAEVDYAQIPSVSFEQAHARVSGGGESLVKGALKIVRRIAGLEIVKDIVKENPDLSREFRTWRARMENLPPAVGSKVQGLLKGGGGGGGGGQVNPAAAYEARFLDHQLRGVPHSIDKARRVLDYQPLYTFSQSMEGFAAWYKTMYGLGDDCWPLLRELHSA